MNTYYVYILECSDSTLYTGVINHIDRRFHEHVLGVDSNAYTFKRRPLKLVYCNVHSDINQAISEEKQIKGWSRKKKYALIRNNVEELRSLSKAYNPKYWRKTK